MKRDGRTHGDRGQSLVELALVLPLLALILLGILDLGRVFHAYITITNAAREGAFYASVCIPEADPVRGCPNNSPIQSWVVAEAAGSGITISAADVLVERPSSAPGQPVTVKVSVPFSALSTMIGSFWGGGALTLRSEAAVVIR